MGEHAEADLYWQNRPPIPHMDGTFIEWCEDMAQYYQQMAAYHRDIAGEHRPSPLSRGDA